MLGHLRYCSVHWVLLRWRRVASVRRRAHGVGKLLWRATEIAIVTLCMRVRMSLLWVWCWLRTLNSMRCIVRLSSSRLGKLLLLPIPA